MALVSTPGYCDNSPGVLAEAEILIESSTGVTWTVTTDEAGNYSYWLDENGSPYTVTASLPGYETILASGVSIIGGQTTPQDFSLRWLQPCLDLAPDQLPMTLQMGMTGTLQLLITNTGAAPASFELIERNAGQAIPIQGAAVDLTIPAGPKDAPVGSAVAAGPYTPRLETTLRIQPQIMQVTPPRVLLLHADDGDGQWIRDQLNAYGDLAAVDTFNARLDTPTLDELSAYDVILTWSNYPYADPVGIGDVLADYVDTGGYVINMLYALGEHGWEMQGRFMDEGYNAIQGGLVKYQTSCLGEHHPTHFIFQGVEDVCEFYRLKNTQLTPGSTAIARWQDGEIFVAANQGRTVISITGYVGYYYRWTGQMDRVVHNAILWFLLGDDIPWLETEPISGTLPADGGAITVDVIFDTLNYQPGELTADLLLFSDDPMRSPIQVPVSLEIIPTSSMGWVEGIVTDLRTGAPLEATILAQGQPYSVTSNADTGEYILWLEPGTYLIEASSPGYVTQTAGVEVNTGMGSTQDFALLLDVPWMQYDPSKFEVMAEINQVITRTLTLTNSGPQDMDYNISEGLAGAMLALHLDEPEGSMSFRDSSGNGYDGFCSGATCPSAGVPGHFGTGLSFDGLNDFIQLPGFSMGGPISVGAWVYSYDITPWWARLFDFSNGPSSDNIIIAWRENIGLMHWGIWRGGDWQSVQTEQAFPVNEWVHVMAVVDEGGMGYIYWNGALIASGPMHTPNNILRNLQYIGRSAWDGDGYFHGVIDDFVVYNRALSPEEVLLLYAGGSIGDTPWLSVDPSTGDVPPNSSAPVQVDLRCHRHIAGHLHHHAVPVQQRPPPACGGNPNNHDRDRGSDAHLQ